MKPRQILILVSIFFSCFLLSNCQEETSADPGFSAEYQQQVLVNPDYAKFNAKFTTAMAYSPEFQASVLAALKAKTSTAADQPYVDRETLRAGLATNFRAAIRRVARACSGRSRSFKVGHKCVYGLFGRVYKSNNSMKSEMKAKLDKAMESYAAWDQCLSKFMRNNNLNKRLRILLATRAEIDEAALTVEGETAFKFNSVEAKEIVDLIIGYHECIKGVEDPVKLTSEIIRDTLMQCNANEAVSLRDKLGKTNCHCVTAKKVVEGEIEVSSLNSIDQLMQTAANIGLDFNTKNTNTSGEGSADLKVKVENDEANNFDNVTLVELTTYMTMYGASASETLRSKVQAAIQAKMSAQANAAVSGGTRNLQDVQAQLQAALSSGNLSEAMQQQIQALLANGSDMSEAVQQQMQLALQSLQNVDVSAQSGLNANANANANGNVNANANANANANNNGQPNCPVPVRPDYEFVAKYCGMDDDDLETLKARLDASASAGNLRFMQQEAQGNLNSNLNLGNINANGNGNLDLSQLGDMMGQLMSNASSGLGAMLQGFEGAALISAYNIKPYPAMTRIELMTELGLDSTEIKALLNIETDGNVSPKCIRALGKSCGRFNILQRLYSSMRNLQLPNECDYEALKVSRDDSTFINNCLFYFQKNHLANSIMIRTENICNPLRVEGAVATLTKLTQGLNLNVALDFNANASVGARQLQQQTQIVYEGNDPTNDDENTRTEGEAYTASDEDVAIDGSDPNNRADTTAVNQEIEAEGEAEINSTAFADLSDDYSYAKYISAGLFGLLILSMI